MSRIMFTESRLLSAILLVTIVMFPGAGAAQVSYDDFTSTSGLYLVGAAAPVGNMLRLTPAIDNTRGAAWYDTQQAVSGGFVSSFEFRISELGGRTDSDGNIGADGFAFVIQNESCNILPSGPGQDMGYAGIPNSLAVEFDTFNNGVWWNNGDPTGNHVSVQTRGTLPNSDDHAYSLGASSSIVDLSDGNTHTGTIYYRPGGGMRVSVDGGTPLKISPDLDLGGTLSLQSGKGWVGFTAATGGAWEHHDILSWSFKPVPADLQQRKVEGNEKPLLGSSGTIANAGCLLTVTTILVNLKGHNVSVAELNEILENTGANAGDGMLSLDNFPQNLEDCGPPLRFRSDKLDSNASREEILDTIADAIQQHDSPVILRVPSLTYGNDGDPNHGHFILAWRAEAGKTFIRDPDPCDQYIEQLPDVDREWFTLDDYVNYVNLALQKRGKDPSLMLDSDLSWLQGRKIRWVEQLAPDSKQLMNACVRCPVELLITDPLGRRLGRVYDQSSGTWVDYDEIPESFYERLYLPFLDPNLISLPADSPIEIQIGDPRNGSYSLEVFGLAEGPFSVSLGISSFAGFDPNQFHFEGTASLGSSASFSFEVTDIPEPASSLYILFCCVALFRCRRTPS